MGGRLYGFRPAGNPLVQIAALIAFGVALIGAVVLGAALLALLFSVAVFAAIAFSIRLWWLRRRARRKGGADSAGELIEAEYRVVAERDADRLRRPD